MIPFLDISNYQGNVDWPTLAPWLLGKHPQAGVIIQLCGGVGAKGWVNQYFLEQCKGAEAAGIQNIGYYDFLCPSQGSGADHADFFFETLGKMGGAVKNCFYAGDFEDNTGIAANADLLAFALDWDGRISRPAGFHPLCYSAAFYLSPHDLTRDQRLADMGLWYAAPGAPAVPATPEPWLSAGKGILMWQYDWHGVVPGIQGQVDLDWLVGDIATLRPYQMGYQVDPLAGMPVNVTPPDVNIAINSQSAADAETIAVKIAADAGALAGQLTGAQHAAALTIQADADRLALVVKEG